MADWVHKKSVVSSDLAIDISTHPLLSRLSFLLYETADLAAISVYHLVFCFQSAKGRVAVIGFVTHVPYQLALV